MSDEHQENVQLDPNNPAVNATLFALMKTDAASEVQLTADATMAVCIFAQLAGLEDRAQVHALVDAAWVNATKAAEHLTNRYHENTGV